MYIRKKIVIFLLCTLFSTQIFVCMLKKLYLCGVIRCILIFLAIVFGNVVGQSQVSNVMPTSAHIANIQTARTDDWSSFHNPASLVQEHGWQLAAQYENRYFLSSLNTAMLQVAYCNKYVNVGIGYSFFGYSKYQEMIAGVTLARKFGIFSLGLQANYLTLYCGDDLGYRGTFIPQVGATIDISPSLTIGVHCFNPFVQGLRVDEDMKRKVPAIYSVGMDYCWQEVLHWSVQADYDVQTSWRIATGVEWQAIERLVVKVGAYYQQQFVGCMGVAVTWDRLRLDANFELHPLLGVICQGRIGYKI